MSEEDRLIIAALNKKVQRRAVRPVSVPSNDRRWSPPSCSRPGCTNPIDIRERDYEAERPYFCGVKCFRLVRDWVAASSQAHKSVPHLKFMPHGWTPAPSTRGRRGKL